MKKAYSKPTVKLIPLESCKLLDGSRVYTDDPQSASSALSRRSGFVKGNFDDEAE